eukprot:jgi/Tetstr1/449035/TSEL_036251.t1
MYDDRLNNHLMQGGSKHGTTTFRGERSDMWHKVRVTTRGGSKKVGYMTTCREGVESDAVFWDVHGGPLKVRNHMRHAKKARVEVRAELQVKRGARGGIRMTDKGDIVSTLYPLSLEVKNEPFRGHGSKLEAVKGTV